MAVGWLGWWAGQQRVRVVCVNVGRAEWWCDVEGEEGEWSGGEGEGKAGEGVVWGEEGGILAWMPNGLVENRRNLSYCPWG